MDSVEKSIFTLTLIMDIRWVAILAILISNEKHETLYKYLLAGLSLRAGVRGPGISPGY